MLAAGGVAVMVLLTVLSSAPARSIALDVNLSALMPLSGVELRTMTSETAALWKPHGVEFRWTTKASGEEPTSGRTLRILRDDCHSARLGAVMFVEGRPNSDRSVTLCVASVVQTVETVKWQRWSLADLPRDFRDVLIGRALGRVLAHELGHYLLASRSHTTDGLMRPQFRADQLIAPNRQAFRPVTSTWPAVRRRAGS